MSEKRYNLLKINEYKRLEKKANTTSVVSAIGLGIVAMGAIMGTSVLADGKTITENRLLDFVHVGIGYISGGVLLHAMVESIVEKIHYKGKREELEEMLEELTSENNRGRNR